MNKALVIRAIKFSLIFMTAFLILNLLTMKEASISSIIVRTVIAAIVFFVIYIIVFTILSSSERKIIYGTTLPIALFICLIFGAIFSPEYRYHCRTNYRCVCWCHMGVLK